MRRKSAYIVVAIAGIAAITCNLVYVFQLQDGSWRIVHDQNTALDFHAFARATGLEK